MEEVTNDSGLIIRVGDYVSFSNSSGDNYCFTIEEEQEEKNSDVMVKLEPKKIIEKIEIISN